MFFELGNYHVLVVTVTLNIFVQYLVVCTLELLLHEVRQTAGNKSIIIIVAFLLIFYFECLCLFLSFDISPCFYYLDLRSYII